MTIVSLFKQHTAALTNHLLPTCCLLCGAGLRGQLLCSACEMALPHLQREGRLCQQCALPLKSEANFCGHCLHKPPAFTRAIIPFSYRHPLNFLIQSFKYRRNLTAGLALAQALATHIQHTYDDEPDLPWPELIIPVPLHWTRRWLRGYNQTEVLGVQLSKQLGIPLYARICRRTRRTPPQKGLNRGARQKNLHQVFQLSDAGYRAIAGQRIALLDDVITTTATTRELSQLLVNKGAKEVQVWALARTPEH